jgi:Recombinase
VRSVRGTWLWLRDQGLRFPLQPAVYLDGTEIIWVAPTYHAVHNVLTHPAYAGAYVFGRTRQQRWVDGDGVLHVRRRKLPQDQWEVLIPAHHPGFIDWDTYQSNQDRSAATSARSSTSRAPARSGKAPRCCRAWPPAGIAAANSLCSTGDRPSPCRTTTATARPNWSTARDRVT